jgi:5-methylcytosine-specific restriction endonuclease McrA
MAYKVCTLCAATKSESDFPVFDKGHYAGKPYPHCFDCKRAGNRAYYRANKAKVIARTDAYAKAHPEMQKKIRDGYKARNQDWYKAFYAANREEILAANSAYRKANPEVMRRAVNKWRKNNPEKSNSYCNARIARKRGNGGRYTAAQWVAIKIMYGYRCLRCGRCEPDIKLTIDHVRPVSKGGHNNISNIQPLCQPCNSSKGGRHCDYRGAVRNFPCQL